MKKRNEALVRDINIIDLNLLDDNIHHIDMELSEFIGYIEISNTEGFDKK